MRISDCVDLERYPLDETDSPVYRELVNNCREQLDECGCCLLPEFIRPGALVQARREAIDLAEEGYQMNHHFSYDDVNDETLNRNLEDLPEDHPLRFRSLTKIRFVARDLIARDNPIQQIHNWSGMLTFLKDTMELSEVYINECPLSACVFTVAEAGELQDWHFDGTDYIVTVMLEDSHEGGRFEFATGLRHPGQEDDFENISKVIAGQSPNVNRPDIKPGTLTLFKGKYSLHRASAVEGEGRRVMAVLSYETTAGRTGSNEYLKLFYGRTPT
ncbi:MAG: hypothetical protein GKR95_23575 [Gammaproteobacteria bacterium]|nr:hypothetical protein [Gammaproteobacteria bacterium]NKB64965.1 hypothetical protein [Gammaproteobacteria bacterium]